MTNAQGSAPERATDPIKTDPIKTDPIKTDPSKTDRSKTDQSRSDQAQWLALVNNRVGKTLLVLALLTLIAVAAMGGFRRASSLPGARYPVAGANATIQTGAFAITPQRAWLADAPPGGYPKPGTRYLVLRMRVENLTESAFAASAFFVQDVVWLPDGRSNERKAHSSRRADDHGFNFDLQPGLPMLVDLVWELPAQERVRLPVTWGVYGRQYVERGYLQGDGDAGWRQSAPQHHIKLQPGAAPPMEAR